MRTGKLLGQYIPHENIYSNQPSGYSEFPVSPPDIFINQKDLRDSQHLVPRCVMSMEHLMFAVYLVSAEDLVFAERLVFAEHSEFVGHLVFPEHLVCADSGLPALDCGLGMRRATHHTTARTVRTILAGSAASLNAASTLCCAPFPGTPACPEHVWGAQQMLIAVSVMRKPRGKKQGFSGT